MEKDIVLSIDVVEPGLVNAVHLLSKELGRPLKGVVLVHRSFVDYPTRPVDTTGFFEEIIIDFDNPDELQKTVLPIMDRILVVTTRYEDAIHHLSQLVPFVPYINTPTESSLVWSTEKPLMRDHLRNYDPALVPQYVRIGTDDLADWEKLTSNLAFPVIVKPGCLWSSFLVTRCNNKQELDTCLQETFKIINQVYGRLRRETPPCVLVEEMMQGDMYTTDAYVSQAGGVRCMPLIKTVTGASLGLPGFYTYTETVPTSLPPEEIARANDAAKAAIRALGLRATTVHVELFLTEEGWKIIELGARIGGGRETLYREAYGIEHHYNDLANRAGARLIAPLDPISHAREEDIYAEEEGVIDAIEGVAEARQLKSLVSLSVDVKPGDEALFANKGGDALAVAFLSNPDKKQLDADAARLREIIQFKIKPRSTS